MGSNLQRLWQNKYPLQGIARNRNPVGNAKVFQGDLTDFDRVGEILKESKADTLVHCAALTNVSECEKHPERAEKLHIEASEYLAKNFAGKLVYISTDMLYDGKGAPYNEDSPTNALNVYGQTKLAGEAKCLESNRDAIIVRTNFFGWNILSKKQSSAEWMYDTFAQGETCNLFTDYVFSPIYVSYLIEAIEKLLLTNAKGIFNIVGNDSISKYDFGKAMLKTFNFAPELVKAIKVDDLNFAEERPRNISLSTNKLRRFNITPPSIQESLNLFKNDLVYRFN